MAPVSSLLSVGLLAFNVVQAHPGHSVREEALERHEYIKRAPKSVRSCEEHLRKRGHATHALQRRASLETTARVKLGLPVLEKRDFAAYNFSHVSNLTVGLGNNQMELFADDSSCILQPEVTQGPYYVDGELIRYDVTEGEQGVPLYLDIQMINTATCEPVPAVYADIWHANSTGVYSGVSASGNGNQDDATNLDNTALRGIQETDSNGVVQFHTLVPGHYDGRAPHIHVLTHNTNSTIVRANGTLLATSNNFTSSASHVGQIFFDQDLLTRVGTTSPYNTNTQTLTTNDDDFILAQEAADTDPFVDYLQLTDDITDGILAWIRIGMDLTEDEDITAAATHYESGGVANADMGAGLGGPFPSGAIPSGALSSGVPP